MEEVATILRNSHKANAQKLKGSDLEDFEKKVVFNYAKNNNLWFNDILTFGTLTNVGGNEHTIVYNKEQGVLYKANNLYNSKFLISYYLEKIRLHSLLFPNTKYDLVGFTGIDKGLEKAPYIEPIAKKNFIPDTKQASEMQIYDYMKSLGFKNVFGDSFRKNTIVVHDLKPVMS